MFPLSDDNSDRRITPWVNYIIIAINVLVFVFFQELGTNEAFNNAFSVIPDEIARGQDFVGPLTIVDHARGLKEQITHYATPVSVYLTLFTSMFMHGGFAHIGGNMLYLWIFGDNLEDLMGHFKYLIFYLLCGVVASLSHVFCTEALQLNGMIPSLGASGAISGVLGGYILLFPNRRVTVFFLRTLMHVPAYVALGFWIVLQVADSSGLLGGSPESAGVAYAAHIGGFVAGLALVKLFAQETRKNSGYYS